MFPSLKVSVSGLTEETLYDICLVINSLDCRRYRYVYHRYQDHSHSLLTRLSHKVVSNTGPVPPLPSRPYNYRGDNKPLYQLGVGRLQWRGGRGGASPGDGRGETPPPAQSLAWSLLEQPADHQLRQDQVDQQQVHRVSPPGLPGLHAQVPAGDPGEVSLSPAGILRHILLPPDCLHHRHRLPEPTGWSTLESRGGRLAAIIFRLQN